MRLKALDGWRGIACLYVALYHLNVAHSVWDARWLVHPEPVLELFFVLSGFVMAMGFSDAIKDTRGFFAYLIRRLGRVYPLHLFTLSLLLLLVVVKIGLGAHHGGFSELMRPEAILPQLLGIQTWVGMGLSWNYPAWTASAELGAYVALGLMVWLIRDRTLRVVAAAAILVIAASLFYADLIAPRTHFNIVTASRCFTGFFFGFILYDLWRDRPAPSPGAATVLEILAVLGVLLSVTAHFDGGAYFLNHLIAALVVFAFASDQGALSKVFSTPPLMWLGKLSFSLYMVHAVIMIYLQTAFYALERLTGRTFVSTFVYPGGEPRDMISLGSYLANDLVGLAYLTVVVVVAAWVHRWIEEPSRVGSAALAKSYQRGELKLGWAAPSAWWGALKRRWTGLPD
jgi:peptidoglycan/LPS O-acetylase OafA/YrhL